MSDTETQTTEAPKVIRRRAPKADTAPATEPVKVIGRKPKDGGVAVVPTAAKPPKELAPIAKEINVRLEKADKLEADANDHRIAAGQRLAEAKEICTRAGISFRAWAEENVKEVNGKVVGFQVIRKLANLGEKEDPAAELERQRAEQAERPKASREKKAAEVEKLKAASPFDPANVEPAEEAPQEARSGQKILGTLENAFDELLEAGDREEALRCLFGKLDEAEQLAVIKSLADDLGGGCKVVFD